MRIAEVWVKWKNCCVCEFFSGILKVNGSDNITEAYMIKCIVIFVSLGCYFNDVL